MKILRQYVGWEGQRWTTLDTLSNIHRNSIQQEEPHLFSIHTEPEFGIGERAFLIQTPEGNVLWDCVALLDADTRKRISELGGIHAIAISHPHYYTTMAEWSRALMTHLFFFTNSINNGSCAPMRTCSVGRGAQ